MINSDILNVDFVVIEDDNGSNNFNNKSWVLGFLFNKTFTPTTFKSFPQFKIMSLK